MKRFKNIVITGASSGIGEALALDYAAPGIALALNGRDGRRLQAVAETRRIRGATVDTGQIDVVDREALAAWLTRFDDAYPVDLLVANAGISIDIDNAALGDLSIAYQTMAVNVGGVFNTVGPLVDRLAARGRGQIALISSLAGFIGLPHAASCNASKAAVHVWGESLRYALKKGGVGVSVVCPGFVESRITARWPFPCLFLCRRNMPRRSSAAAFPQQSPNCVSRRDKGCGVVRWTIAGKLGCQTRGPHCAQLALPPQTPPTRRLATLGDGPRFHS